MHCHRYTRLGLLAVVALRLTAQTTIEDFRRLDSPRESLQDTTGLLRKLALREGDWVADIGAGGGYHVMRLSEIVGPAGKVFAEEISDRSIGYLKERAALFGLKNVVIVKGDARDPMLPEKALAGALMVDTYHHLAEPAAMLNKILQTLKPGGRLVIADYSVAEHRRWSREEQLKVHEIAPEIVKSEAVMAGFEVSSVIDPFAVWKTATDNTRGTPTDLWLLVLRRPK